MKGHYNHDKNTFHLPRQYMSVTDFRICFKGHGGETRFTDAFEIASAATSTEEIWNGKGNPIYPPAQAELRRHGIGETAYTNFSGKRARQVTKQDYQYYDYLLCADSNNIRNTLRITGPDKEGKVKLLLDFTDRPGRSIADPVGIQVILRRHTGMSMKAALHCWRL